MVIFAFIFAPLLLLAVSVGASPHHLESHRSRSNLLGPLVLTPIGIAQGTTPIHGISQFAVKYASARRWQNPAPMKIWELPNGSLNPSALPKACPQSVLDSSQYSEDCLSMMLYVPSAAPPNTKMPVFLWIHGGSFIEGSATAPGLNGAILANATKAIVAVVQYRLGALGFNSPDGRTNFAVQDIIASLNFLRGVLPSFGGDVSKITLAGQSSGANLIRALLATPSAAPLFQSAILHSDPMDFGFQSPAVQSELQQYFNTQISCAAKDTSCLCSLPLSTVLSASDALFNNAVNINSSATREEPMRPVHDGVLITSTLDSSSPFPHVSKTIILSTVKNEAGPTIYSIFPYPIDASTYEAVVESSFAPGASNLFTYPGYQVPNVTDGQPTDDRVQLEQMGTDQIWRCPTWTFARSWTQNGGSAFVAQYTVGATYPDNLGISYCSEAGAVCHEDDIEIVFGTVSNPTSAQSSLINEVQTRYKSFLYTGNPNPSGAQYPLWSPATTGNFSAQNLGSPGTAAVGACNTQFWGTPNVPYDYQVFGI